MRVEFTFITGPLALAIGLGYSRLDALGGRRTYHWLGLGQVAVEFCLTR